MFLSLISQSRAALAYGILFLISLGFAFISLHTVHSQDQHDSDIEIIANSLAVNDVVRTLSINANDVFYNSFDQKLYITSPSSAGAIGNTVTAINPVSGQTLYSIFVGSEPGRIAVASDGQTMYVVLDGASAIRKIDLASQTAGLEFFTGSEGSTTYYGVSDLAVAPGTPNRVAVARTYPGSSPPGAGVAIFDDGVRLQQTGPGHSAGANFLAFASSSSLYGGGYYEGLRTMTVSNSGVVDSRTNTSFSVGRIKLHNGLIYTSGGQVIQPETRTLLGTFPGTAGGVSGAFAIDEAAGRALYAVRDYSNNSTVSIKAYDLGTYTLLGSLVLPSVTSDPVAMVRYGGNGVALLTSDRRIHLIQTSLIPTNDPLPTPSATPTVSPTPSPTAYPAFTQPINLLAKDLVYNASIGRLVASVPSTAALNGNSICVIDPGEARIESTTFVGSDPNKLAVSSDGSVAWVGLDGSGTVRRFDLTTRTAGPQFSLSTPSNGLGLAQDIAVLPGTVDTIAVSGGASGLGLFDNGVRRGPSVSASGVLEFRSQDELLVGGYLLTRYAVSSAGLSRISEAGGGYGEFQLVDGNRVYYASGKVFDLAAGRPVGSFDVGNQSSWVAVDPNTRRAFFLSAGYSQSTIKAFDIDTFRPIGTIVLPALPFAPTNLVRWGADGLAWRDDGGQVYIMRSTLVNPNATVPAPTPAVSPTPVPSPTPPATFVRSLDIPAGDVVSSSFTNQLHIGVTGAAGPAIGNSIVGIDPITAQVTNAAFIGSEPGRLALSDDGKTLYARLNGAGDAVRRFNVETNTAGQQFIGPPSQSDMRVMPGSPQTIAFASGSGGVSVWDNGVKRGNSSNGSVYGIYSIDFMDASTIYGYSSSSELVKFLVTPSGINPANIANNIIPGYQAQVTASDGLLYFSSGRVFDPALGRLTGTFSQANGVAAVDQPANRIYFYENGRLSAYDLSTFLKVGSVTIPILEYTATRMVRWGRNGLAIRTVGDYSNPNAGRIYLVQSALVAPSEPVPTGIQFNSASYSAYDGYSSPVRVTVARTGDLSNPSSVNYQTVDGTATAGSDYTAVSGTLTFAPGESAKTIDIPILPDGIYEPSETFGISLGQPSGSNVFVIAPQSAIVTITNGDSRPNIRSGNRFVSEYASPALIPVTLTNPSTETVTVNFTTSNGSAQAGSDYTATSGTLTFAPLETTKTIPVTILNDGVAESSETFSLILSNPVNGSLSFGSNFVVTIFDSPGFTISGVVTYGTTPAGQSPKFVPGVLLNGAGEAPDSARSITSGEYSLSRLGSGTYTVTPSKSGDINGVSALDAARVAQHAAGLIVLSPNQQIAADATGGGGITALDAARIAQTAAGIFNSGIVGQWKFSPGSRSYTGTPASLTGENYEAILVGDVTGNWNPPFAPRAAGDAKAESDGVAIALDLAHPQRREAGRDAAAIGEVDVPAGAASASEITIPVSIGDTTGKGIVAYDFTLVFDPNLMRPADTATDAFGTLSDGWSIIHNPQTPGRLRVTAFSTSELAGKGTLLNLRFEVLGENKRGTVELKWATLELNEGEVRSSVFVSERLTDAGASQSVSKFVFGQDYRSDGNGMLTRRSQTLLR
jgi:hypothetical protein